jgi:hypothetical protein
VRPPFYFAPAAIALMLLGTSAPVHADFVLLNNLDQKAQPANSNPFVGQSFIAGTVSQTLYGAEMQLGTASPPSSSIELEVEARNANGTVGMTLFSNFSSSYNATTGLITFLAKSNFVMAAGTGYWLVLSDSASHSHDVNWEFTASNVYQSNLGYGLPSFNTAFVSNKDNGMGNITYYQPSDGPQLFALLSPAPTIPEPPSFLLIGLAAATLGLARWFQSTRLSRSNRHQIASKLRTDAAIDPEPELK